MAPVATAVSPSRVYTIWNSRGRYAAFMQQRAMLMAFRAPEPAQTLANAIEGYYCITGHWPRLEFGTDSPFLYSTISGPPQLVRVVGEDLEDLSRKCRDDFLDMLVINDLSIDDLLMMHGSVISSPWDPAPSAQYLRSKFAASVADGMDDDGMAGRVDL